MCGFRLFLFCFLFLRTDDGRRAARRVGVAMGVAVGRTSERRFGRDSEETKSLPNKSTTFGHPTNHY